MKIIQIIKPEEDFYNVYKEGENEYKAKLVYFLGLTESGAIIGIELGKNGFDMNNAKRHGYIFTTNFSELIEFEKSSRIRLTIDKKNVKITM